MAPCGWKCLVVKRCPKQAIEKKAIKKNTGYLIKSGGLHVPNAIHQILLAIFIHIYFYE